MKLEPAAWQGTQETTSQSLHWAKLTVSCAAASYLLGRYESGIDFLMYLSEKCQIPLKKKIKTVLFNHIPIPLKRLNWINPIVNSPHVYEPLSVTCHVAAQDAEVDLLIRTGMQRRRTRNWCTINTVQALWAPNQWGEYAFMIEPSDDLPLP